jgi:hypothetical protein
MHKTRHSTVYAATRYSCEIRPSLPRTNRAPAMSLGATRGIAKPPTGGFRTQGGRFEFRSLDPPNVLPAHSLWPPASTRVAQLIIRRRHPWRRELAPDGCRARRSLAGHQSRGAALQHSFAASPPLRQSARDRNVHSRHLQWPEAQPQRPGARSNRGRTHRLLRYRRSVASALRRGTSTRLPSTPCSSATTSSSERDGRSFRLSSRKPEC